MEGSEFTFTGRDKGFVDVSTDKKSYLKDKDLSLKAKGLMVVIAGLSNNKNWKFKIQGLIEIVKEGEHAVYSAIKELREAGYCEFIQIRDDKKRVIRGQYNFFEQKRTKQK